MESGELAGVSVAWVAVWSSSAFNANSFLSAVPLMRSAPIFSISSGSSSE